MKKVFSPFKNVTKRFEKAFTIIKIVLAVVLFCVLTKYVVPLVVEVASPLITIGLAVWLIKKFKITNLAQLKELGKSILDKTESFDFSSAMETISSEVGNFFEDDSADNDAQSSGTNEKETSPSRVSASDVLKD